MSRKGRKSAAQTSAPQKDRIYLSKINRQGSAASKESAKSIVFSESILETLKEKADNFNKTHPAKKVSLNTLKAVFRRGAGAYSKSHRPTISGGKPNSRTAWAYARVNKFLLKKGGTKVKAAYVQDDDLMEFGGETHTSNMNEVKVVTYFIYKSSPDEDELVATTDDKDEALKEYTNINLNDFEISQRDKSGLSKRLDTLTKTYKFVGQLDDGEELLDYMDESYYDDEDYWKLVDEEFEELDNKTISRVNEKADNLLDVIKSHFGAIGGYRVIPIGDENLILRIKDHTGHIKNRGESKYFLSVVISDQNPTLRFKERGVSFKPSQELYFTSDDTPETIISVINDHINEYKGEEGVNFQQGGLIAPNGKKSNLTPEQYKLVRTPQFKAWFGDWENDPANASKVVDENGEPLVVHHGTKYDFNTFRGDKLIWTTPEIGYIDKMKGIFESNRVIDLFANSRKILDLSEYGYKYYDPKTAYNIFLGYGIKLSGILTQKFGSIFYSYLQNHTEELKDQMMKLGYDGVKVKVHRNYDFSFGFLHPNQIKLADGTNTTFNMNNNDIRFEQGGLIAPNGKPSNLTPEQYKLVRTPQFKAWFGDWENNPAYASKVVDENGEPLVVYHGGGDFNYFDALKIGKTDKGWYGYGFYFSPSQEISDLYGHSKPYFINIKKIFNCNKENPFYGASIEVTEYYINEGYEGSSKTFDVNKKYHEYCVFFKFPNNIKLADGSNTTFDGNNPDIRFEEGGKTNVGKLAKGMSISEVAQIHNLRAEDLQGELLMGIKTEMEHTNDPEVAKAIALDHLYESSTYYTNLKEMERNMNLDEHYEDISKIYAIGGTINNEFSFRTPTGEPSKLNYLQQVLVRTKAFKEFFGDWEFAAKMFLNDGRQNYEDHYKNVSKVIDHVTLEPRLLYHGTRTEQEFFIFDVSQQSGVGRPYGYFAYNEEYSQNFTTTSQRSQNFSNPFMYRCFLNVRNPFYAIAAVFMDVQEDASYWLVQIARVIAISKYKKPTTEEVQKLLYVVDSQIGGYIRKVIGNQKLPFWILMSRDEKKEFKYFLNNYLFDGVFYFEEYSMIYDIDNPAEFTQAVTIFEANQIKLADGRNLTFDPMNADMRYKYGGNLQESKPSETHHDTSNMSLKDILTSQKFAEGGKVVGKNVGDGNDGKKGGYFKGRSHADGGIKAYNSDSGQMIEVEGEEVIITKGAVNDQTKREFEGQMLTNKEILSRINQSGGGVAFAQGGEVEGHKCGCSGKTYKYGGELMDDFSIVNAMNKPFEIINTNLADARRFVDMLVYKLK